MYTTASRSWIWGAIKRKALSGLEPAWPAGMVGRGVMTESVRAGTHLEVDISVAQARIVWHTTPLKMGRGYAHVTHLHF